MINIPIQLMNTKFRFVLLGYQSKKPIEKEWTTKNNYSWNNPKIQEHLKKGHNVGLATGYANIAVLDSDCTDFSYEVLQRLNTYMVETGSSRTQVCDELKIHAYVIIEPLPNKVVINDLKDKKKHLGELQVKGQQVLIEGCTHPTSKEKYKVYNDAPIKKMKLNEFITLFNDYNIKSKDESPRAVIKKNKSSKINLNVDDIISTSSLTPSGVGEYFGSHPVHGSETGMNFWINPNENVWHCFRCNTGGSWAELIAVIEGIIDCGDAGKGCLQGEKFIKVLENAKEKYGLKLPEKHLWSDFKL